MRNFRKANATHGIVLVGIFITFITVTANEHLIAQTANRIVANKGVYLEALSVQDSSKDQAQPADKPEEDKWALTDEDRMSDEEMDQELFGKSEKSPEAIDANNAENSDSPLDEKESPSGESNDSGEPKKKSARLAPRLSIETYLRSINTLTVDTFTPRSNSLDGVDVPTRQVPPQTFSTAQYPAATVLRFQTPDIHHQPLYFEDQNPERYGVHRHRLQPLESARKFASDTISWPREMRCVSPGSCVYRANSRYNRPSLIPPNR